MKHNGGKSVKISPRQSQHHTFSQYYTQEISHVTINLIAFH